MEDREFGAEFSAGLSDSIAIVVVKRTAILFWSNSAHVYGPRPVRICIKMGGFFFFYATSKRSSWEIEITELSSVHVSLIP
jgi:hypothetical protein